MTLYSTAWLTLLQAGKGLSPSMIRAMIKTELTPQLPQEVIRQTDRSAEYHCKHRT